MLSPALRWFAIVFAVAAVTACGEVAPHAGHADADHDSIPDADDRCAQVAEDYDGIDDEDGCPESDDTFDRDSDGVADRSDECPDAPEDIDSDQDADGCPDR